VRSSRLAPEHDISTDLSDGAARGRRDRTAGGVYDTVGSFDLFMDLRPGP
jgi:hypothetical protein